MMECETRRRDERHMQEQNAKNVLVTGADGRIGRLIYPTLIAAGWHVTRADVQTDLFKIQEWKHPILHLAVDWADPARTFEMTRHLLENLQSKHFVLASSITIAP